MFIDTAQIEITAGKGGDGATSFRKEKWVDKGGPDGGDGGNGGNVVLRSDNQLNTLRSFRHKKKFKARPGQPGDKKKQHGKTADDLIIMVPVGTLAINSETKEVVADLDSHGQSVVVAQGGRGGFGNAHFVNSRRQAPKFSELGDIGEQINIDLELKLLADIGLVGLPNAGKSTFIGAVTNARPKVAGYAFTTLSPGLGIADIDGDSLLIADIPGLIEGAHEGKGLGDEFLRHIERTKAIAHLVDYYSDDIAADIETVRKELDLHGSDLLNKPQLLLITKTEGVEQSAIDELTADLNRQFGDDYQSIIDISSSAHKNLDIALRALVTLKKARQKVEEESEPEVVEIVHQSDKEWSIDVLPSNGQKEFRITSPQIERFARQTDFSNPQAAERFTDILRKKGILKDLSRKGWSFDQDVVVGKKKIALS